MQTIYFFHGWRFAIAIAFMQSIMVSAPVEATTAPNNDVICRVTQFNTHFDDRGGEFDGMSQSGTLLILRNIGVRACQVNAFPALKFEEGSGSLLTAERRLPRGMHPGPVFLPLMVAPGAEVVIQLRWVSSDVYDGNNCVTPDTAVLTFPDGALRLPFGRTMCAAAGKTEFFEQAPLVSVVKRGK